MKNNLSQLRVLLVEDQDRVRRMMKDVLAGFGISQIYEYQDAEKALQFLSRSYDFIDVVLCDLELGGKMDGLALLNAVRTANMDISFVMISGRSDAEAITRAKEKGVDGYILKPFSPEQVEVKLRIVLSQARAA